jgi:hypothetical protein
MHRVVDFFELAIYLPGINALLDGLVPYRDFFHLRGPLELYVPAFFMGLFGKNISVLYTYFYVGTVATLIIWVLVGKELFKSRLILYLFTFVLVARTFPRVVFQIWGGMRYGLGALAILWIIKYIKTQKPVWMGLAGIATALSLLTSIEIGVFVLFSIMGVALFALAFRLYDLRQIGQTALKYALGMLLILLPYGLYLWSTNSLMPFVDAFLSVTQNMGQVFPDHLYEDHPRTLWQALMGMNPASKHFKHLTPAYCFLFFTVFMVIHARAKQVSRHTLGILTVALYGFIMYVFAFRKIGAAQFEMALQPEKLVLFFMLEHAYFILIKAKNKRSMIKKSSSIKKLRQKASWKIVGINTLLFLFLGSSVGYPIQRYHHRFFAFRYVFNLATGNDPLELKPSGKLVAADIPAARGLYIPPWQKKDFQTLRNFVQENIPPGEKLFTFPELGIYNFIVDRPFVGKFPVVIFSWFNPRWEANLFQNLKQEKPRYALVPKKLDPVFDKVYFKVGSNRESYNRFQRYIQEHYTPVATTRSLVILRRKD